MFTDHIEVTDARIEQVPVDAGAFSFALEVAADRHHAGEDDQAQLKAALQAYLLMMGNTNG